MNSTSKSNASQYTIAFYNLENLFDTKDDRKTLDDDFTKNSHKGWGEKRFRKKIKKLGKVISNIGYNSTKHPPALIGVAEVENLFVLEELVASKFLKSKNYDIVHFDSPDERGIDTALLYRKDYFSIINSKVHTLYLENEYGQRDYTRDVLHVYGKLEGNPMHILINHWPSRRAGPEISNPKRLAAATKNREIISQIFTEDPSAKIMVMGDFNDDPASDSIAHLKGEDFYNPMEKLHTLYSGSTTHRGSWNLFNTSPPAVYVKNSSSSRYSSDFSSS
jgi:hypothetical protein